MIKRQKIARKEPQFVCDTAVSFRNVPAWFGHTSRSLKMDIIYPEDRSKRYPAIVWVCGGGWMSIDRSAHLAYLSQLARAGFVVASIDYRLSHEASFPAQIEDLKAGVRFLRAHADRYSIDPTRFGSMGESAGGHLAGLLGLTGETRDFDKGEFLDQSSAIQATCAWYMVSDFEALARTAQSVSAPEMMLFARSPQDGSNWLKLASPLHYVSPQSPPFLFIHGTQDRVVALEQSHILYNALEKVGVDVDMIEIEGADHADIPFFQPELWEQIIHFFQSKLGAPKSLDEASACEGANA